LTTAIQFILIGLGLGSSYALFAQGVVLIYRGSGIVNFAQGALGMVASYVCFSTFRTDWEWPIIPSIIGGILVAVAISLAFQFLILRSMKHAAPIVRLISTLGLLVTLQAAVELRYGAANKPVEPFLPSDTFNWGGIRLQEQVLYIIAITWVITFALWALVRYTRTGLAITAAAENERAVQTLGWSPNSLSAITWAVGGGIGAIAGILVAPLTGLSIIAFTNVVTIAALAAALLGGFRSFPLTLVGGYVVGIGESLTGRYERDIEDLIFSGNDVRGLPRAVPFIIILIVLVVRGRGLPLRSHISDRLPKLGTGVVNIRMLIFGIAGIVATLLFVFDDRWAASTYVSLSSAVVVLSVIVITGLAGQLSLGQLAIAGLGALFAGSLVLRADWPMELAIPVGILLTIPAGVLFALPALRTRGINLAVLTLGLGFVVQEVIFQNGTWIGHRIDGGTKIGSASFFGLEVDAAVHPKRWAFVCLIALVLAGLLVANLRRSRTGRRLIAVRTNERAAASLGIGVVGVKLYAFGVAAGIAGLGGVLIGFQNTTITYGSFNIFSSIFAVGFAVIGGLGFVVGALFSAPNALGGLGSKFMDNMLDLGAWDALVGGFILLLIVVFQQDGIAEAVIAHTKGLMRTLRLTAPPTPREPLTDTPAQDVPLQTLSINDLVVRFGGVTAVDGVSFDVKPGEVVGLIGPNGAGKTTIIDAVTGFVKATSGSVALNDDSIETLSATQRARRGLRRSFQSLELFEDISIEDNIKAGADVASRSSWVTDLFWPGKHELPATAVVAVKEFELEPHLDQLPAELPYGRRRLVGLARTVASGPSVVMLDEPAAGLDESESRELASLIRKMADERKMAVLLVEHDVGLVMSTCDRIVVIDFGVVIASGTPSEIRTNALVKEAYLGHADEEVAIVTDGGTP